MPYLTTREVDQLFLRLDRLVNDAHHLQAQCAVHSAERRAQDRSVAQPIGYLRQAGPGAAVSIQDPNTTLLPHAA